MKTKKQGFFITISFAVAALMLAFSGFGQEGRGNGRVKGLVVDEEGMPLEGVHILMEATSYNFKLETVSDKKGRWVLVNFSKDNFNFTFNKEGYTPVFIQVGLSGANRNPDQKIALKKISQLQLDQDLKAAEKEKIETAVKLYDEQKYGEALELFKEFVASHPTLTLARLNLGQTYQKLNRYQEALEEFHSVLTELQKECEVADKTKISKVYILMAEVYMDSHLYEEAAAHYKKALEISPATDPAVPFNVAEVLFTANKVDEAIPYYQQAVELDPQKGLYYLKLGYAYLNKGDIESAVKSFEKFLELSPDDPQAESIKNLLSTLKKQ